MTNQLQIAPIAPAVFNFNSLAIRVIADENGEPWFLANDVCAVLGYANPRDAIAKHCRQGGVAKRDTPTESGIQEMSYINEGNLYRLIIKSRKPEAEPFESWVCDEVLPSIRKTGKYETPQYAPNPKAPRAKFSLPGGLTLEQQDLINDTIAERVATLPKEKQGKAALNIRGAVVSKWDLKGTKHGYKNIPSEQFTNVMNLIARLELDGDNYLTMPKNEMLDLIESQVQDKIKALPAPEPEINTDLINILTGRVKELEAKVIQGEVMPKTETGQIVTTRAALKSALAASRGDTITFMPNRPLTFTLSHSLIEQEDMRFFAALENK